MSSHDSAHRPPPLAAVSRAQLRLVLGLRPRGMWIALGIVVAQVFAAASAGILFGITISTDHDQKTRVLFSRVSDFAGDLGFAFDEGAAGVTVVAVAAFVWAFFWPYRVWRDETPERRDYHWSMPVDRRTHDLLRVGVGLVLLPLVTAVFVLLAVATAAAFGHTAVFPGWGGLFWLGLFAAPPVIYLLTSIPVVGSRHPAAWLWGTLGAGAALISLTESLGLSGPMRALLEALLGRFGLLSTLGRPLVAEIAGWASPPAGSWLLAWLLWLAVAATGVWLAASRRQRSI